MLNSVVSRRRAAEIDPFDFDDDGDDDNNNKPTTKKARRRRVSDTAEVVVKLDDSNSDDDDDDDDDDGDDDDDVEDDDSRQLNRVASAGGKLQSRFGAKRQVKTKADSSDSDSHFSFDCARGASLRAKIG